MLPATQCGPHLLYGSSESDCTNPSGPMEVCHPLPGGLGGHTSEVDVIPLIVALYWAGNGEQPCPLTPQVRETFEAGLGATVQGQPKQLTVQWHPPHVL